MRNLLFILFILVGLTATSSAQTNVEFILKDFPSDFGQDVGIRGNAEPLSWGTSISLKKRGSEFFVSLKFPKEVKGIEFKFVYSENGSEPVWEITENRVLEFGKTRSLASLHRWNVEQVIDITALPLLQPEELMEDYQLVEQMILEVHPGIYRYNDKLSIRKGLDGLKEKFQKPLTRGEAYLAMSKVTAMLKCDHTKVGFNNQTKTINSVIHGQSDKLPFTFTWLDGKMIVIYDATKDRVLERGAEVLSINGVEVGKIQETMFSYIAADGATDKNRIRKMEVDGYDFRYNAFDVFFPLLFPSEKPGFKLEVLKREGVNTEEISVEAITREERTEQLIDRYEEFPKTRDDLWNFKITDDNIGILEVNSFGLLGWKSLSIDYKDYLQEVFREIDHQNIERLIIDIRKNAGGNDEMSVELFSYLDIKKSVSQEVYREGRTRYLSFPEPLKSNVQTWGENPWYFNLKPDEENSGYYIFKEDQGSKKFTKKKKYVFKGDVYLLTSSTNTSLAYYTALNFKRQGLGTIIGQETGGNLRGINGGQILFLRLPNSGIEIDFPIMGGFVYGNQPNKGVTPDIEVTPTAEQIINGEDVELNVALEIIKKK